MDKDNHFLREDLKTKKTGIRQYKVDLSNRPNDDNNIDSEILLPHERDEAARPPSTKNPTNKNSREVIKQAYDDIKEGLKDTDSRGIPSDIVGSDTPDKMDKTNVNR